MTLSIRNPEKIGKKLPMMNIIIQVFELEDVVGRLPEEV